MAASSSPSPLRPQAIELGLPPLHAAQEEVLTDNSRFRVVVTGRQWGKTTLGAIACIAEAGKGGDAWWVAPTYPLTENAWRIIVGLARQIPNTRIEGRPVYRITLPSGGSVQMRSAENPDSLRGSTLSGLVIDEAALCRPETWGYVRPTLTVRQGWVIFISTPKGLNWFHDIYADAGRLKDWRRWRFPSTASPYVPQADVALARETMSSLVFSQEYEAEFIAAGTGMFRETWLRHYRTFFEGEERYFALADETVADSETQHFHTIDLAWSPAEDADFTVISSWAVTPKRHLILLDCNRGHYEGPDIVPQIRLAWERWGGLVIVERATRQMSIIQEAARTGLPVREVRAERDKQARALPATARAERGAIWFDREAPYYRDIVEELLAFPAGRHDDFVDTLSYAVLHAAGQSRYEERGMLMLGRKS